MTHVRINPSALHSSPPMFSLSHLRACNTALTRSFDAATNGAAVSERTVPELRHGLLRSPIVRCPARTPGNPRASPRCSWIPSCGSPISTRFPPSLSETIPSFRLSHPLAPRAAAVPTNRPNTRTCSILSVEPPRDDRWTVDAATKVRSRSCMFRCCVELGRLGRSPCRVPPPVRSVEDCFASSSSFRMVCYV